MNVRQILFSGFTGCSDGSCIISGPAEGVHTNGGCKCLLNLSRSQLCILSSRLHAFGSYELANTEWMDSMFPKMAG